MDIPKNKLFSLICILLVIAMVGFYRHLGIPDKSPLTFCTIYLFTAVCMLWQWRKVKTEFVKRCILAAPSALLLTIIFRIVGFETAFSIYVGMILFLFLVIKTDNCKQHFFITLMTAIIFMFLLVYIKHSALNVYKAYIISAIALPFMVFYIEYLVSINSKKTIEWGLLLLKSAKFTIVLFLSLTLLLLSNRLCRHYDVSSAISFGISVLIALGFLGFCYRFKINLSDSSVSNKTNEKTKKARKCTLCGRSIHSSELSHAIKDRTVCEHCYKKIQEEKARITP